MDSGSTQAFGTVLRRYRRAAGLTQEAVAERAGISARTVSNLERGVNRAPHRETVALLAAVLDLPPAERLAFVQAAERLGWPAVGAQRERAGPSGPSSLVVPPLVGRVREMALLERHLAGAGPPVLMVAGEPGIGKSRLLHAALPHARTQGWQVLQGGCQRRHGQEPYAPLLEALQRHIRGQRRGALRTELQGCAWLVRLLPELADSPIPPLPAWTLAPPQERRLMAEAVIRFLSNVAGPAGTLLVLDDLQWAGGDALALVEALVRAGTDIPLRVVGAYRDTDVDLRGPLARVLADLAHAGLAAQHTLAPLTTADAEHLLAALLDGAVEEQSNVWGPVVQRTGGVPFFLVSYAQLLRGGRAAEGRREAVPWDVGHSVRQRVAALSAAGREVLAVAAVAGRVVPYALLAASCGWSVAELAAALEEACRTRLLEEAGDDAYQFTHDLIREVVEADMGAARRRLAHGRLGHALEGAAPADLEALAYHYSRSAEQDKAILYLERAAERARAQYAHERAAAYYREVATRRDGLGQGQAAAHAREQAGLVLQHAGQYEQALALLEHAAACYQATDDLEGWGRVVASIGQDHLLLGTPAPVQRLEQTLARLEEQGLTPGVVVLCTRLSELYYTVGRYGDQWGAAERAVAGTRALGDERLRADTHAARAWALYCRGRQEEALPDLDEALRLAEATGHLAVLCDALQTAAAVYRDRGAVERQCAYSDRAVALAERLGDPALLVVMLAIRGVLAFFNGYWRCARADCERALATSRATAAGLDGSPDTQRPLGPAGADDRVSAPSVVPPWGAVASLPQLYLGQLCLAAGELPEATQHLEAAARTAAHLGDVHDVVLAQSVLAQRDLLARQPAAAAARLAAVAAQPAPRAGWEWQVTPLPVLLAWAHLDQEEVEQAAAVAGQAVAQARATQLPRALVEALWMQARVALRQERWTQACSALEEGIALAQGVRYPYGEARLLHVCGQMHLQHAATVAARERLEAAQTIFQDLGARRDAARVAQAIERLSSGA